MNIKSYENGLEAGGWRWFEPESQNPTQKWCFFPIVRVQLPSSLPIFPDFSNLHIKNAKIPVFLIEKPPISGLLAFLLPRSWVTSALIGLSGALLSAPLEPATLFSTTKRGYMDGGSPSKRGGYHRGARLLSLANRAISNVMCNVINNERSIELYSLRIRLPSSNMLTKIIGQVDDLHTKGGRGDVFCPVSPHTRCLGKNTHQVKYWPGLILSNKEVRHAQGSNYPLPHL